MSAYELTTFGAISNQPYQQSDLWRPSSAYVRSVTEGNIASACGTLNPSRTAGAQLLSPILFGRKLAYSACDTSASNNRLHDSVADYQWEKFENDINTYQFLAKDWDGHGSGPITPETTCAAQKILLRLRGLNASPEWVIPTTDETIMLQFGLTDQRTVKLEVQDDETIGLAIWKGDAAPCFLDASLNSLESILAAA